jgi:hypothetical protein
MEDNRAFFFSHGTYHKICITVRQEFPKKIRQEVNHIKQTFRKEVS